MNPFTQHPARLRAIPLFTALLLSTPFALAQPGTEPVDPPTPAPAEPAPSDVKPAEPKPEELKPEEKPAEKSDPSAEKPADKSDYSSGKPATTPPVAPAPKVEVADSPAKAILRAAADTVKSARSLSFKVKLYGEGGMLGGAPTLETDEKMLRAPSNANIWLIRAIGSGASTTSGRDNAPKGSDPAAFDVVWTATTTSWIEHAEKTVYTRPLNAARGKSTQAASSSKLRYFNLPNPFQKELQPADFTQEDPETINGELCDVVSTKGDRGSHDRYAISQKDHFPRRIEKVFDSERVKGRYVTDFTNVKINEDISESYFKIPVPEGYKENIQEPPKPVVNDAAKVDPEKTDAAKLDPSTISAEPSPAAVDTSSSGSIAPAPPAIENAPDIDLPLNSGTIKMSSLKGNVVVLDFFGTWALSSKGAHEELKKVAEKFKDRPVKFLSFAIREKNPDAATEYLTRNQLAWDLAKRGDPVGAAFGVKTYPFWIVVDQEGHIKYRSLGSKTDGTSKLDDAICDCLGIEHSSAATPAAPAPESAKPAVPAGSETKPAEVVTPPGTVAPVIKK